MPNDKCWEACAMYRGGEWVGMELKYFQLGHTADLTRTVFAHRFPVGLAAKNSRRTCNFLGGSFPLMTEEYISEYMSDIDISWVIST